MVLYPNKLPESERVCSGICSETVLFIAKVVRNSFGQHTVTSANAANAEKRTRNLSALCITAILPIRKMPEAM